MRPTIVNVGSAGIDMVIKTDHLPSPGETVLGGTFFMNPGGKGANQAVAAARLGGQVIFICKTGNDIFFGQRALEIFGKEGIDTSAMIAHPSLPSAVALITIDRNAENCIVVAPGSNATFLPGDLSKATAIIENASIILMQLEIPVATVEHVADIAEQKGIKLILNPAPAVKLSDELLKKISVITPNESEAEILTGIKVTDNDSAKEAAISLHKKGVKTVIITLGAKGALVFDENEFTHVPSLVVEAADTTAAGDIFNGALAVALTENKTIVDATTFACKAAAICVTRLGAQSSAPYRMEVDNMK